MLLRWPDGIRYDQHSYAPDPTANRTGHSVWGVSWRGWLCQRCSGEAWLHGRLADQKLNYSHSILRVVATAPSRASSAFDAESVGNPHVRIACASLLRPVRHDVRVVIEQVCVARRWRVPSVPPVPVGGLGALDASRPLARIDLLALTGQCRPRASSGAGTPGTSGTARLWKSVAG